MKYNETQRQRYHTTLWAIALGCIAVAFIYKPALQALAGCGLGALIAGMIHTFLVKDWMDLKEETTIEKVTLIEDEQPEPDWDSLLRSNLARSLFWFYKENQFDQQFRFVEWLSRFIEGGVQLKETSHQSPARLEHWLNFGVPVTILGNGTSRESHVLRLYFIKLVGDTQMKIAWVMFDCATGEARVFHGHQNVGTLRRAGGIVANYSAAKPYSATEHHFIRDME